MLKKSNRLVKAGEFQKVLHRGKRIDANFVTMRIDCDKNDALPRFGIIVSTKVSKKAVTRNLIKRRVRQILREWLRMNNDCCNRVVFIAKNKALDSDYQKLKEEIYRLMNLTDRKSGV